MFIIIALIASLHFLAFQFYLYWRLWWFDSLMHFISGLWVAIAFFWAFFQSGHVNIIKNNKKSSLIVAIVSSFAIGIMWEIFEYSSGAVLASGSDYIFDTISDIFFDLIGGLAGYYYFIYKGYHNTEIKN
ncbi:MAG: hypothetical protein AAB736_02035 [Patescibacteria group bacterium]